MGVFLLENVSFELGFKRSHQLSLTRETYSYHVEFIREASFQAIDDTPQSTNLLRVVNSAAEAANNWILNTKMTVMRKQKTGSSPSEKVTVRVGGSFLENLYVGLGCRLSMGVKMKLYDCGREPSTMAYTTLEAEIRDMANFDRNFVRGTTKELRWRPYSDCHFAPKSKKKISGTITIQLFPRSNIVLQTPLFVNTPGYKFNLDDDATKDFTLIGCDGTKVRCHKELLTDCSKFFNTILSDNRWTASRQNEYKFKDYAGPVVEAFVQYLYYTSTAAPSMYPAIAFALLELAHVYEVRKVDPRPTHNMDLERSLIAILLGQPWIWFDILSAWNIYVFSTEMVKFRAHLMEYEVLKRKAKHVIQWFVRRGLVARNTNRYNLRNNQESQEMISFKEVVEKNREAVARELEINPDLFI